MKNKKVLTILFLILFLSAIGCSDFYNWAYVDDDQYLEEIQDEKEGGDETKIFYEEGGAQYVDTDKDIGLERRDAEGEIEIYPEEDEEQDIDTDKDSWLGKRDVEDEIEIYPEEDEEQDIDTSKDRALEKRDAEGEKTYYENEQYFEF